MPSRGRGSNYRKGRAYELEVQQIFEANGYDVSTTTNSKGVYDVIATKTEMDTYKKVHYVVLMQCKTRKRLAKALPEATGNKSGEQGGVENCPKCHIQMAYKDGYGGCINHDCPDCGIWKRIEGDGVTKSEVK